jgi:hypothetical protein
VKSLILAECYFCQGDPGFNITSTSCIICYQMVLSFKLQMTREKNNIRTDLNVSMEGRENSSTVSYEGNSISKLQIQVTTYVFEFLPIWAAFLCRNILCCIHIFCLLKTHNTTLFYRGACIQGRRHLVTAATPVQSCAYRLLCVTITLDSATI